MVEDLPRPGPDDPRALVVRHVTKRYALGETLAGFGSLREALSARLGGLLRGPSRGTRRVLHDALDDVSFDVRRGEAVGLVGRNGAGKSTLLRILSRITEPSAGQVWIRGRVGSFLEVGTGFHPELTGRENVELNGALLGLDRREIRERLPDIVAFADVAAFMDTPLKRFSSGMSLRLAFAIQACLEPEILVIDEVLAVGDRAFQERCLAHLEATISGGRTLLFVSHDLEAVARATRRCLWLENGRVAAEGETREVLAQYTNSIVAGQLPGPIEGVDGRVVCHELALLGAGDRPTEAQDRERPLRIRLVLELARPEEQLDVVLWIGDARGRRVAEEAWSDAGRPFPRRAGRHVVEAELAPRLAAGSYTLGFWVGGGGEDLCHRESATGFRLLGRQEAAKDRVVHLDARWSVGSTS